MNPKTASTLNWAAAICILLGTVILSPSAGFLLNVVAVLLAIAPAGFAAKATRLVGVALLLCSLTLAYLGYPAFAKEQQGVRDRAAAKSGTAAVSASPGK